MLLMSFGDYDKRAYLIAYSFVFVLKLCNAVSFHVFVSHHYLITLYFHQHPFQIHSYTCHHSLFTVYSTIQQTTILSLDISNK
jgi:hypothetical protein